MWLSLSLNPLHFIHTKTLEHFSVPTQSPIIKTSFWHRILVIELPENILLYGLNHDDSLKHKTYTAHPSHRLIQRYHHNDQLRLLISFHEKLIVCYQGNHWIEWSREALDLGADLTQTCFLSADSIIAQLCDQPSLVVLLWDTDNRSICHQTYPPIISPYFHFLSHQYLLIHKNNNPHPHLHRLSPLSFPLLTPSLVSFDSQLNLPPTLIDNLIFSLYNEYWRVYAIDDKDDHFDFTELKNIRLDFRHPTQLTVHKLENDIYLNIAHTRSECELILYFPDRTIQKNLCTAPFLDIQDVEHHVWVFTERDIIRIHPSNKHQPFQIFMGHIPLPQYPFVATKHGVLRIKDAFLTQLHLPSQYTSPPFESSPPDSPVTESMEYQGLNVTSTQNISPSSEPIFASSTSYSPLTKSPYPLHLPSQNQAVMTYKSTFFPPLLSHTFIPDLFFLIPRHLPPSLCR